MAINQVIRGTFTAMALTALAGCGVGGYVTREVVTASNADLRAAAQFVVATRSVKIGDEYRLIGPKAKLTEDIELLTSDYSRLHIARDRSAIIVKVSRQVRKGRPPKFELQLYGGFLNRLSDDHFLITLSKSEQGKTSQVHIPFWRQSDQIKILRHKPLAEPLRSEIEKKYKIKLDDGADLAEFDFDISQADLFRLLRRIITEGSPIWTEAIDLKREIPPSVLTAAQNAFFDDIRRRRAHYYSSKVGEAALQFKYLRLLDKQKQAEATFLLARSYAQGIGTKQNWKRARLFAARAVTLGREDALEIEGFLHLVGAGGLKRDVPKAMKLLRAAAKAGSASAMHNLSYMYISGIGVSKDESLGVIWRKKAAARGFAPAMADLGWRYLNGLAVEKDISKGIGLIEAAHELGDLYGTTFLGRLFAEGIGKKKVPERAKHYLSLAAKAGHIPAQYELGWRLVIGDGIQRDLEAAEIGCGRPKPTAAKKPATTSKKSNNYPTWRSAMLPL